MTGHGKLDMPTVAKMEVLVSNRDGLLTLSLAKNRLTSRHSKIIRAAMAGKPLKLTT